LGRKNAVGIQRLVSRTRLAYYVFDLLFIDGLDLSGCQLVDRKDTLKTILKPSKNVRFSEHIIGEGEKLYKVVTEVPLEGIIAKRSASKYVQRRSTDWIKIKAVQELEVVIGGYTEPRHTRSGFGALVVGLYNDSGLQYVGHVGGGFNERTLGQIFRSMQTLRRDQCPFQAQPETNEPVQWVEPQLVAQVKFTEWTADKRLRQPVFLRIRDDQTAKDCRFEESA
jgi:bifunctional non-homologous end joining protein LigD